MFSSSKSFDAALGLIKLRNIDRIVRLNNPYKEEITKAVLNRVFELTDNPSYNTLLDLSILLHQDINIVKNWFIRIRELKRRNSNSDVVKDFDKKIIKKAEDIPATIIMQILCIVKDSLAGRSKMRRSKVNM
ncbi:homeobox domain-containing protein 7 [Vairimorpha necatrix]|uniref:Homeobox domain-containing protein 7 n=1 Tax=Vairimorpha necatrix TaxID=6039 RepID=A0AAX4JA00_9MICR